jgi:hypothetical protein
MFGAGLASGMAQKPAEPQFVPGQVLVKFNEGVSEDRIEEIVRAEGGQVKDIIGRTGVYLITIPEKVDTREAVNRFSARPEVLYAEPNYRALPLEE